MLKGDITGWTGQQIVDFLLKYPTPTKALLAGANTLDTYYRAACTPTGMWFLPIHAQNRLNAGDKAEYDAIMGVIAKCQQVIATAQAAVDSSAITPQPQPTVPTQPVVIQIPATQIAPGTVPPTQQVTVPAPAGTPGAPVFNVTESDYLPPFLKPAQPVEAGTFLGMSPMTWLVIGAAAYFLFKR